MIFKNNSISKSPNKIINERVNGFSDFKENNSHQGLIDEGKMIYYLKY